MLPGYHCAYGKLHDLQGGSGRYHEIPLPYPCQRFRFNTGKADYDGSFFHCPVCFFVCGHIHTSLLDLDMLLDFVKIYLLEGICLFLAVSPIIVIVFRLKLILFFPLPNQFLLL